MSESHNCVAEINALLADKNTQISVAISFSQPERELIQVATCKMDTNKRVKPMSFFASHCPFCGMKLATGEPA